MNPNPYPNGRWTSTTPTTALVASDSQRSSGATAVVRPSCLDSSPSKWLHAPVAPDMLASTLHELFWGAPDSDIATEARARIERVIEQAAEQPQFFPAQAQAQEAAYVRPAC